VYGSGRPRAAVAAYGLQKFRATLQNPTTAGAHRIFMHNVFVPTFVRTEVRTDDSVHSKAGLLESPCTKLVTGPTLIYEPPVCQAVRVQGKPPLTVATAHCCSLGTPTSWPRGLVETNRESPISFPSVPSRSSSLPFSIHGRLHLTLSHRDFFSTPLFHSLVRQVRFYLLF
jgi:hypothetical protein